jgi:hypothetical protein
MSSKASIIFENEIELNKFQNLDLLLQQTLKSELKTALSSHWNKLTLCLIDNQKVIVDRTTWITKDGFDGKYETDDLGYPM